MNREWIEQLLAKTDLVSLISKYVRLTRKGSDYWGCCPFHHEKTPSFKIYESTNSYHCFGCKESGDAITFLAKIESIERIDAIKMLAEEAGLELPKYDKAKADNSREILEKKERLYALLTASAKFYFESLSLPAAEGYRKYLQSRAIDSKLIRRFGIGASLDWHGLIDHLNRLGFTNQEMKDAGVAGTGSEGLYDTFKGRVMFPIINIMDKVVSFSGRIIESSTDFAKYKNGTQTLVFDKSKTLFGINLLKKKKRLGEKIDHVILVEGHLDTVMMHGAGFDCTVASMGTALTHSHAKQIKNFTNNVYISYDGDAAGNKATLRGLDILASSGINVRVVDLPSGMDPDDVIKKYGADYYKELMKNAQTLTAYKISTLKSQFDLHDVDGKSKFAVSAINVVKGLDSPVLREEYLSQIASITGYAMSALRRQIDSVVDEQIVPVINVARPTKDDEDDKVKYVLAYIVSRAASHNELCIDDEIDMNLEDALDGIYLDIYHYIKEKGTKTLYSAVDEQNSTVIDEIINYDAKDFNDSEGFTKHLNALLSKRIADSIAKLSAECDSCKNEEMRVKIKHQINGLLKKQGELKKGK